MLTPAEIAPVVQDCFNQRDGERLLALWADDFHYEGPGLTFTGKQRMLEQEHNLWIAFPDIRCEVTPFVASHDHAALITRMRGTHRGTLRMGNGDLLTATGRPVDFTLAVHMWFRGGLLAGERVFYDTASLLRQLGLLAA